MADDSTEKKVLTNSVRIGRQGARQLQDKALAAGDLLIWTVYERPLDHPDIFIARPFISNRDPPVALPVHLEGDSLKSVRLQLPIGLVMLYREDADEPQIVESWI